MTNSLTCFKAYDVRGELGVNFDAEICYRIGRAFARTIRAKTVVVGRDARATSPELADSLCEGMIAEGVTVLDIGMAGTEEMYWATSFFEADGGIEITASHNPINYNGLKMVKSGSRPLDPETDLLAVKACAEAAEFGSVILGGQRQDRVAEAKAAYVEKVISFVDVTNLRPIRIVVNSGNGAAGPTFDALAQALGEKPTRLNLFGCFTRPTVRFPMGSQTHFCPKITPRRAMQFWRIALILVLPLMVILIAVSSLMKAGALLPVNILSACLPQSCWKKIQVLVSFMIRGLFGTPKIWCAPKAALRCRPKLATHSSSKSCANLMRFMAVRCRPIIIFAILPIATAA